MGSGAIPLAPNLLLALGFIAWTVTALLQGGVRISTTIKVVAQVSSM